jgi:hypothetical protein
VSSDQSRGDRPVAVAVEGLEQFGRPAELRLGDAPVVVLVKLLEAVPGVAHLCRAEPAEPGDRRLAGQDGVPHPEEVAPVSWRRVRERDRDSGEHGDESE